jgi:NADH-quinone oxidoreductase subunit J
MKLTPELIIFGMLAGMAALSAVGVVAFKNAVRSALCLVFTFFILGFLYFALHMEMLGITQIVVYTGAIMVLFLFVIMLLNLGASHVLEEKSDPKKVVGLTFGVALAVLLASQIVPIMIKVQAPKAMPQFGSPQVIGSILFTDYVYPFEAVSVLLLLGIVGSVLLAKRRLS